MAVLMPKLTLTPPRTDFSHPPEDRISHFRDALAYRLANWILNHIATPWYRNRIHGLILVGILRATRPNDPLDFVRQSVRVPE
jgi:hypothetical protein